MPSRLSISTRWTVRYTAAMFVTLSLFSGYVYSRVERRIDADARLLLRLQLALLTETVERHPDDPGAWKISVDQQLEATHPELRFGAQVYDETGRLLLAEGSLAGRVLPVPEPGRKGHMEQLDLGGETPFFVASSSAGDRRVRAAIDSARFAQSSGHIARVLLMGLGPMLLLTAGVGWLLSRRSLRPIAEITRTARRVSGTHLGETVPTRGSGDELDDLATTLNEMIVRIREGMDRVRRFSVDAAHQLRTPLAALRSQIEVTRAQERPPAEYRRVLGDLLAQVEGLGETVHGMLRLAHSEGGLVAAHRGAVDVGELLTEVAGFFAPLAEEQEVAFELDAPAGLGVSGDPTWLRQMFGNLLSNALGHTPCGGRVRIEARAEGAEATVRVRDSGPGVAPADRERIFEPFERGASAPARPGAGVGLSLAREIARAHGGSVVLESDAGPGASFLVRLPRVQSPSRPASAAA